MTRFAQKMKEHNFIKG